jgi:hypothetical protein
MAQQVWPLARLPLGGSNVALGAEAPRPVLVLAPGAEAMAVLPQVPVAGLDLLEASLAVPEGAAEGLEVAAGVRQQLQADRDRLAATGGPALRLLPGQRRVMAAAVVAAAFTVWAEWGLGPQAISYGALLVAAGLPFYWAVTSAKASG